MISFFIGGTVVAQERPRFARVKTKAGKDFVTTYDPSKSKSWKETVAWQTIERGCKPLEGPLKMTLVFRLKKPKSAPKSRIWPVVRPDLDNYIKGLKDGLNKICYQDDSQICILESRKEYATDGYAPGVQVKIEQI